MNDARIASVAKAMKAPIDPPTSGAAQQQFELRARRRYRAPKPAAASPACRSGFPLWKLVWTLGNVGATVGRLARVHGPDRGATRRFLAWDLGRPYPKAYPTTGFRRHDPRRRRVVRRHRHQLVGNDHADGDSQVTLHGLPAASCWARAIISGSLDATETASPA
jgi:hypothetical protein